MRKQLLGLLIALIAAPALAQTSTPISALPAGGQIQVTDLIGVARCSGSAGCNYKVTVGSVAPLNIGANLASSAGNLVVTTGTSGAVIPLLNGNLTLSGVDTFTNQLAINLNTANLPTALTGAVVHMGNANGVATRVEADAFGTSAYFSGVRYDGINGSATTLQANDEIGGYNAFGYNGSAIVGPRASFRTYAAQNWTTGANGTYADVATTADGGTTLSEVIRFENDGGVTIPSTVTGGDKGAGTINVGGLYINGVAVNPGAGTVTLGTSAAATNPQRSGEATTGWYSVATGQMQAGQSISSTTYRWFDITGTTTNASGTDPFIYTPILQSVAVGANALATQDNEGNNTAVGNYALNLMAGIQGYYEHSTFATIGNGFGNTAVGADAMGNATASGCTADTGAGGYNTAVGMMALRINTCGLQNTAIGEHAGAYVTTGSTNTILGTDAWGPSTGSANTIIGELAGGNGVITTGGHNDIIGFQVSSIKLTTGSDNILIGNDNTTETATTSTANGIGIGQGTVPGTQDVAIGLNALNGTTADSNFNVAVGYSALKANTTGASNTAVGYNAATAITTATDVSAFGTNACANETTLTWSTCIGAYSGHSGGGITATGAFSLQADTGNFNTAYGYDAGNLVTSGTNNVIIGPSVASTVLTTGSSNILIGTSSTTTTANASDSNTIAIGGAGLGAHTTEIGLNGTTTAATIYGTLTIPAASVTIGVNGTSGTTGSLILDNGVTSGASTTISPSSGTTTAWTMTLPTSGGTNGYVLQTNGSGVTSWVAQSGGGGVSVTAVSAARIVVSPSPGTGTFTLDTGTSIPTSSSNLGFFASTTSAQLAGIISDETGTGALVFANGPTLIAPALGTPASGVGTNLTGLVLGTSASVTNPQRSGQASTGFYSPASNTVAVATNGIEVEQWNTIASGVDYLSITPSATGGANQGIVTVGVAGSDTNINLALAPKGNGAVTINGGTNVNTNPFGQAYLVVYGADQTEPLLISNTAQTAELVAFTQITDPEAIVQWGSVSGRLGLFTNQGTTQFTLDTNGGCAIGTSSTYDEATPPANGCIIQGLVGIGTASPVSGSAITINGLISVQGGATTCGTGCASITSGSVNTRGSATSSSSVTSMVVNWSTTLAAAPFCVVGSNQDTSLWDYSTSTTALTITIASAVTSKVFTWICMQ